MFRRYFSAVLWLTQRPFTGLLLVGLLGAAEAGAQVAPTTGLIIGEVGKGITPNPPITLDGPRYHGPGAVVYIDGKRQNDSILGTLNPNDIASVGVLKDGSFAQQMGPDEARLGVLFVTTKAGEHTHQVRAFNRRLVRLRRAQTCAEQRTAAP
jgi:hypothetical protein